MQGGCILILGIGVDLVTAARVQAAAERFGRRFLGRLFTAAERELCRADHLRLAGRIAAKEALLKAIGTGLRGFSWQELEIIADAAGAPVLRAHGRFARALAERGVSRVHLSISHTKEYAVALAILEGGTPGCTS